jgi:hypothetical protein
MAYFVGLAVVGGVGSVGELVGFRVRGALDTVCAHKAIKHKHRWFEAK